MLYIRPHSMSSAGLSQASGCHACARHALTRQPSSSGRFRDESEGERPVAPSRLFVRATCRSRSVNTITQGGRQAVGTPHAREKSAKPDRVGSARGVRYSAFSAGPRQAQLSQHASTCFEVQCRGVGGHSGPHAPDSREYAGDGGGFCDLSARWAPRRCQRSFVEHGTRLTQAGW